MRKILIYIWRVWFWVLGLFLGIFIFPFIYLFAVIPKCTNISYKLTRLWCLGMFYGMGFRYELIRETTKEIDKHKQYIIIANHTSMMDGILLCVLHPNHFLCFVGKKELENIPLFGTVFKKMAVSVDRKDPESRAEVYVKCAKKIKEGKSVAIFPEGGVTDDMEVVLQGFRNGAFSMATQHQFEIIVYTFIDLKYIFPFDNFKGHPAKIKVYLNDILEPHSDMEFLKEQSWHLMNNTLHKHI